MSQIGFTTSLPDFLASTMFNFLTTFRPQRLDDFVAIDFETANNAPSRVCSGGIVIVRNRKIVDKFYSLIRPYHNYYTAMTISLPCFKK